VTRANFSDSLSAMRKFFSLIFQLLAAALLVFIAAAAWIVFDGLNDHGDKADVAWVAGHAESAQGTVEQPLLDRVVERYHKGEFPFVIVSGSKSGGTNDEPAEMSKYLESHGIPESAIIVTHRAENMQETAGAVARIMKAHEFRSVMVVTDYYRVTRAKLVLNHEGIAEILKAHVGQFQAADAWEIGREVVALYKYVGTVYLLPAAEKAKDEAQVGIDKAKVDAEQAKKKVDKGLDNMAK